MGNQTGRRTSLSNTCCRIVLLGTTLVTLGGSCTQNLYSFPQAEKTSFALTTVLQPQTQSAERVEVPFRVYTLDHQPLENVSVQTVTASSSVTPFESSTAYTNHEGYIAIDIPKDSDVELVFKRPGFQTKTQSLYLQTRHKQPFLIYLEATESAPQLGATPAPNIPSSQPTQFVQQYYDHLSAEKVGQAWQMLALEAQRQSTSYSVFYSRWSRVEQVQIQNLVLISQSDDWAIVEANVAYLIDESPRAVAPQRFTLMWNATVEDWQVTKLEALAQASP